jgi:hypothetical protein
MSTVYVWTVTETGPFDSDTIETMKWKCEKIDDGGNIVENSGDVTLTDSISVETFKTFNYEQVNNVLFENINKTEIESAL